MRVSWMEKTNVRVLENIKPERTLPGVGHDSMAQCERRY